MGTSASSKGPGAGVSFDPPWLNDIDVPGQDNQNNNVNLAIGIAPEARFRSARRSMGEYVRSGSRDSARKSLGHYSKTGMGCAHQQKLHQTSSTSSARYEMIILFLWGERYRSSRIVEQMHLK